MKPDNKTIFKPLSEIGNYTNKDEYFCSAVVFSPETENNHFHKCPPYIEITKEDDYAQDNAIYFEVPEIIAYYAKTHPAYTMKGIKNYIKKREDKMARKIKDLLNI